MIIRPVCRKEFVALPNSLFNDRRLSADTRAMIALLLSKPRGWELRPVVLARHLSRAGEKPVGPVRLRRMFREASEAGYMARSARQGRSEDGSWGRYDYFIGMPTDVAQAVKKAGVAIVPHACEADTAQPQAADVDRTYKEQSLQKTDSRNSRHHQDQPLQLGGQPQKGPPIEGRSISRAVQRGQEVVQHRVAQRLGLGDAMQGWLLLGALSDRQRDQLTALERAGHLTDIELATARESAGLDGARSGTSDT